MGVSMRGFLNNRRLLDRILYLWKVVRYASPPFFRDYPLLQDNAFKRLLAKAIACDNVTFSPPASIRQDACFCLYTHSLAPGGAELQWCFLAQILAEKGYSVVFLVDTLDGAGNHWRFLLDSSSIQVRILEEWSVEYSEFSKDIPCMVRRLMSALSDISPNYLLCQLDATNIRGAAAALLSETKSVDRILLSFRNVNPSHFLHLYWPYMRPLYRLLATSRRVVMTGNSAFGCADYARWLGIKRERIPCVSNSVSLPKLGSDASKTAARTALNVPQNIPVVLGVFRLSPEKRPAVFFDVIRRLQERFPNILALHAGSGELSGRARTIVDDLLQNNALRLLGVSKDVNILMQATDILLLSSDVEGLPNVVLEAQSFSVPVVATRVGGVPESVVEGGSALLAAKNDVRTLVEHCSELLENPERRAMFGRTGRAFIKRNFSQESVCQRVFDALCM